jgi:hypothetical protein
VMILSSCLLGWVLAARAEAVEHVSRAARATPGRMSLRRPARAATNSTS